MPNEFLNHSLLFPLRYFAQKFKITLRLNRLVKPHNLLIRAVGTDEKSLAQNLENLGSLWRHFVHNLFNFCELQQQFLHHFCSDNRR